MITDNDDSRIKNAKCWSQVYKNALTQRNDRVRNFRLAGYNWTSKLTTLPIENYIYLFCDFELKDPLFGSNYLERKCMEGEYKIILSNAISSEMKIIKSGGIELFDRFPSFATTFLCSIDDEIGYVTSSGKMKIEIQVIVRRLVIEGKYAKFNFGDPLKEEKTFSFRFGKMQLHAREQMLQFHSHVLASLIHAGREIQVVNPKKMHHFECLLQLIHGVRIDLNEFQIRHLLPIAFRFKVHTVIRKCERHLIDFLGPEPPEDVLFDYLNLSVWYHLHRLFRLILRYLGGHKDLKKVTIQKMNMDQMSGEEMKTLALRLFDLC